MSVDSVFVHKMWDDHELSKMVPGGIPFPMLSDGGGKVGAAGCGAGKQIGCKVNPAHRPLIKVIHVVVRDQQTIRLQRFQFDGKRMQTRQPLFFHHAIAEIGIDDQTASLAFQQESLAPASHGHAAYFIPEDA